MEQAITQSNVTHHENVSSGRLGVWVRWVSLAAIVVGLLLVMSVLPMQEAGQRFESWVTSLGVWGPVAFVLVYIVATVLMIPGSALTLVAGAVFGLWAGTAVVSVASTGGAAAAFLIGRYLARDRVAGMVKSYPRFRAIDRAVGQGGWKIVALLRLSPVVPFNLQNYLYGLTAIRFWPAVLASWVAMLPGTFMFVYLGYVGRTAAAAATDAESSGGRGQTVLLIVGLVATVVVTVYVTKLATKAVKEHTQTADDTNAPKEQDVASNENNIPPARGKWGVAVIALIGVLMLTGGAYARMNPNAVRGCVIALIGPPEATTVETQPADDLAHDSPPGKTQRAVVFDHSAFDSLLKTHVDADGWVDYEALAQDAEALDAYIATIAKAPFDDLGRDEQLALLINGYNAFTLRLILDYSPLDSIRDIPSVKRWDARRWEIANGTYSLNQIEHELIRKRFAEPRIHFSLVCAAYSCPPLRNEAFVGGRLEEQLHSQAVYVHTHRRWFQYDPDSNTVNLTSLYEWYGDDFKAKADSVLDYAAGYVPALRSALDAGQTPKTGWISYNWKLNSKANKP